MKLCFPIQHDQTLDSEVFGHFGSAPAFMLVDTNTAAVEIIDNADSTMHMAPAAPSVHSAAGISTA